METKDVASTNKNMTGSDSALQPVIYGILPEQAGDKIDLGELFFRLTSQWKLILSITAGGGFLAILLVLALPRVYRPAVTVSIPPVENIAPIINLNSLIGGSSLTEEVKDKLIENFSDTQIETINTFFGGNNGIPATPQEVFNHYFNLFRSNKTLEVYIDENQYLKKIYPDDNEKQTSTLLFKLLKGLSIEILEPAPQVYGGYVADPKRINLSLEVKDEAIGVSLLNGYVDYVNQQLTERFQKGAIKVINGRVEMLNNWVETQREQFRQQRLLTIEKMEHENVKKINNLQNQISASLDKAKLERQTQITKATEALAMAQALGVTNPNAMDLMTKKGMKENSGSASIAVVDNQSIPLYLYGSKYLTKLIETLKSRVNDEDYADNINELREKIYLIENDAELAALKSRKSDDSWIAGLTDKLAKIDALKKLTPDFSNVLAYNMDNPAIVTGEPVKPKRKLIVALGFVFSFFIAVFVVLIVNSRSGVKQDS